MQGSNETKNTGEVESQRQPPATLFKALNSVPYNVTNPPMVNTPELQVATRDNMQAIATLNYHYVQASHPQHWSNQMHQIPTQAPMTPPTPTMSEPEPLAPKGRTKETQAPRKGKGARSGKNARTSGHSDTEIQALDEKIKKEADIVIPPARAKWDDAATTRLIEYITAPEQWGKVSTALSKICQDASQNIFKNEFLAKQCETKWQIVFRMYKDTRRHLNHTGGGDSDEDLFDVGSDDDHSADVNGKSKDKIKRDGGRYNVRTLEAFSQGPLYAQILQVAEGRADIDCSIEFSSHRKPEDIDKDIQKASKKQKRSEDDGDDITHLLTETLRSIREHQAEAAQREGDRFSYQKHHDEREEAHQLEKMKLEREMAELHRKREVEELRFTKLNRYRQMRDSNDPLERDMAKKLAEEIRVEQGL